MKIFSIFLLLLLAAGCSRQAPKTASAQAAQPAAAPLPAQWEYKVLIVGEFVGMTRSLSESKLNEMGAQGWELVGFDAAPNPKMASARDMVYYLRRQKAAAGLPR